MMSVGRPDPGRCQGGEGRGEDPGEQETPSRSPFSLYGPTSVAVHGVCSQQRLVDWKDFYGIS